MAKQITDQPALTTADTGDLLLIRDISAGIDKKVTASGLAAAVAASLPAGSIVTASIAADGVTPDKMLGIDLYARAWSVIAGTPPAAGTGQFYMAVGSSVVTTDAFGDGTVTMNTAFPNGTVAVIPCSGDAAAFNGTFTPNNFTASTFGVRSYPVSSGAKRCNYIAIGW